LERDDLYVRVVVKIPTLKCIVSKIRNIYQTISQRFGKKFVLNALKGKSGETVINDLEWSRELDFVYINMKTGERRLK
jgi:hypothetical protein